MIGLDSKLAATQIPLTIIDYDGNKHHSFFRPHGITGAVNFENFRLPLETLGAMKRGRLGNADVSLFCAAPSTEIIKRIYYRAEYDVFAEEMEIPQKYYI